MLISQKGLEFIESEEGCVLYVYKDVAGYPTIGIGHKLRKGESFPDGINKKKAYEILKEDIKVAEETVTKLVKVTLTQAKFDMLVDFVFNCGVGAFRSSTLLKVLNMGLYDKVPTEMKRWNTATGPDGKKTVLPVLSERRRKEAEIWINGYS